MLVIRASKFWVKLLGVHIWGIQAMVTLLFQPNYFSRLLLVGVVMSAMSWDTFPEIDVGAAFSSSMPSRVSTLRPPGL